MNRRATGLRSKRVLSIYDGRRLLGHIEITSRDKRKPKIIATNAAGKRLGSFESQRAALAAIDKSAAIEKEIALRCRRGKRNKTVIHAAELQ